mgnify:CR=1 FL=1
MNLTKKVCIVLSWILVLGIPTLRASIPSVQMTQKVIYYNLQNEFLYQDKDAQYIETFDPVNTVAQLNTTTLNGNIVAPSVACPQPGKFFLSSKGNYYCVSLNLKA